MIYKFVLLIADDDDYENIENDDDDDDAAYYEEEVGQAPDPGTWIAQTVVSFHMHLVVWMMRNGPVRD